MANLVIADPEKNIRQTILEILKPFKHNLFEAEDGDQVLKFVKEKRIHAVIFDAELPVGDGPDLIPEVRKIRYNTAVVAMVGIGEDTKSLLARGALTTITKPFNVQDLRRVVIEAIEFSNHAPKEPPPLSSETKPAKPRASWKKIALWAALIFVLLAGGAAGTYFWKMKNVPLKFYSIPYNNLSAIASDGKWIWTCDWFNQTIYRHNQDAILSLSKTFNREDTHPSSVVWDGENLWTYAAWENKLVKHAMDKKLSALETYEELEIQPYAMSYDGKNIWFCDDKKGILGRFMAENGKIQVQETFNSPGQKPVGVFKTGRYLWSADAQSGLIYKHSLEGGFRVLEAFAPPAQVQGKKINCFWTDGKDFWIGSAKSQKIYQFRAHHLKLAASVD